MPALLAPALLALSLAAPPAEPPGDWTVELRGGLAGLVSHSVSGFPRGPSADLAVGRVVFEGVEVELAAGFWRVDARKAATTFAVVPVTASVKLFGPPDLGFHPYLVAGGGLHFVDLALDAGPTLGTLRDRPRAWGFHGGLGILRPLGDRCWVGADARYHFLQAATDIQVASPGSGGTPGIRLDGLRLSLTAGARF